MRNETFFPSDTGVNRGESRDSHFESYSIRFGKQILFCHGRETCARTQSTMSDHELGKRKATTAVDGATAGAKAVKIPTYEHSRCLVAAHGVSL